MEVQFIAQGLSLDKNKPSGDIIIEALASGRYNSFVSFVAFISSGGITNIKDQLVTFISSGNNVHLYVGVDLHGTSKEALDILIEAKIPTTVVYSPNSIVYHPKIYLFRGEENHLIIIGSSNLTTSGLFQNIEASICLSFLSSDEQGIAVENSILDFFETIVNNTSESIQPLSKTLLELLVSSNIVLSESTTRQTRNSINEVLPKVTCQDRSQLKRKFKTVTIARPPKGYKRVVRDEIISISKSEEVRSTVVCTSETIEGDSMWIESGQMTGGSRNILDLSKQGKRDGAIKFGSVEFFGINKDEYSTEKDITLLYNGKKYIGNTIKYAPKNSNWRIQLKGITETNDKFTDILRANGAQNKVFIFEKTDDDIIYKFHILDTADVSMLKDISSDWTHGGRSGTGRLYGIINS